MKVLCIGSLSPSKLGLNEYLHLLLRHAQLYPEYTFVVFADVLIESTEELLTFNNVRIVRGWKYNSWFNIVKILRFVSSEKPDAVWFNVLLSTFGDRPIPAFLGLMSTFFANLIGYRVYVTLHHLVEFMEMSETKFKGMESIVRFFSVLIQKVMSKSGHLVLLLDKYVEFVAANYNGKNPIRMHHGFPQVVTGGSKDRSRFNILVFGKFGSYKKLDFAVATFLKLVEKYPHVCMTVAGSSHPSYPGYYENFANKSASIPSLMFKGYLSEKELEETFLESNAVFLPYTSSTGVSGVAHIAASYGLPIVAPNLPDFRAMVKEEGIQIEFFEQDHIVSACASFSRMVENPGLSETMGCANIEAAKVQSFDRVLGAYIKLFNSDKN